MVLRTVELTESDWDEVLLGLDVCQSRQCGSERERAEVQAVIDRLKAQLPQTQI